MNQLIAPATAIGFLLCSSGESFAQTSCRSITDDQTRLACYDKVNGTPTGNNAAEVSTVPAAPAQKSGEPSWLKHFAVRDQGTWNNIGTDPATVSVSRNKGQDASLIKAAVIWTGNTFNDYGWQPFASAAVNRNTLKSSATDVHSANAGITGSVFDFSQGFAVWSTLSGSAREDIKKDTASNTATFDNYLAIPAFVHPAETGGSAFSLFPRVGLQYEDQYRVAPGSHTGTYKGSFWGGRGVFTPGQLGGRLQFQAVYQHYHDFSVSSDVEQRTNSYTKLSVDYDLYDPTDETSWFKPVIGLSREVGSDPLVGSLRNNITSLALKLKVN